MAALTTGDEVGQARLRAVLATLERCAAQVSAEVAAQAPATSEALRREAVAVLDRAGARLSTARGRLLLAQKESGAWQGAGDPSFEAFRGRVAQVGVGAASKEVGRAQTLRALPVLAGATEDGAITLEHVDAVAQVTRTAPEAARTALATPEGQAQALAMARCTDAGTFKKDLARWAAGQDLAGHEKDHQAQRAERFLHLSHAPDGTRIRGRLDRITGHRLQLALEAASPRPAPDDDRSPEQRRADALSTVVEHALTRPGTGASGAAVRPHVSLVMTEDTFTTLKKHWSATATGGRDGDDGAGSTCAAGDLPAGAGCASGAAAFGPVPPVVTEDGLPVPLSEVARTLCDCTITRIVLGADSEPLDVGRTERLYTGTQRRAVLVRDGHCAWPGCGAPARWCEVHHIRWWDRDDGPTSVTNGIALCSFHHHEVHHHDLTIHRTGTRPRAPGDALAHAAYQFRRPDGTLLTAHTRAHDDGGDGGHGRDDDGCRKGGGDCDSGGGGDCDGGGGGGGGGHGSAPGVSPPPAADAGPTRAPNPGRENTTRAGAPGTTRVRTPQEHAAGEPPGGPACLERQGPLW